LWFKIGLLNLLTTYGTLLKPHSTTNEKSNQKIQNEIMKHRCNVVNIKNKSPMLSHIVTSKPSMGSNSPDFSPSLPSSHGSFTPIFSTIGCNGLRRLPGTALNCRWVAFEELGHTWQHP